MKTTLSQQESVELIKSMMLTTRQNMAESAGYYLVWGWSITLAFVAQYILLRILEVNWHYFVWPVATAIGVIGTLMLVSRQVQGSGVRTFADMALQHLWIGWSVLLVFVLLSNVFIGWKLVYILLIALYGTGTFVSGGILKFKPLQIGGIAAWLIAGICFLTPALRTEFSNLLLMGALSLVVSYLVPAYLLKSSKA